VATPRQFKRRGRWTLILGVLFAALTFGAVMAYAGSSSSSVTGITVNWDGKGVNDNGTCESFVSDPDLNPGPGQQGWLFILTSPASGATYQLTTSFTPSFQTPANPIGPFTTGGSIHFVVYTLAGATLNSASATGGTANSNLTVSHCEGGAKAQPTLFTAPGAGGAVGLQLNDVGTLAGGSDPTGFITFRLFAPGDTTCQNAVYVDVDTVNGNADYGTLASGDNPGGFLSNAVGTWRWTAHYSGDSANEEADSGCDAEQVTIDKADTTSNTTIVREDTSAQLGIDPVPHVPLGTSVHDTATVGTKVDSLSMAGTLTYSFYNTIDCTGTHSDEVVQVDADGIVPAGSSHGPLGAGNYSFNAVYSGNLIYNASGVSTCEPLTVDKAQLVITTQIHNAAHQDIGGATHTPLGTVAHDTATVTGVNPAFPITLVVSFTLNGNAVANLAAGEAGFTARSVDSAPLGAGSYTYAASVAGDNNYEGGVSGDEPLTVDQARLSIITTIHNAAHQAVTFVPVGSIVHDTASVTGFIAGFPLPSVSFTLNGNAVANLPAGEVGFTARSVDSAPLVSGSYTYAATVASDSNYIGATSADEPLAVRTFGKTMGFWGNRNGQALIPSGFTYTLGQNSATTCYLNVTKANTTTIFPNTKNGVTLLTNCTTVASRDAGINTDSMNVLLAQALALKLNIQLIAGFDGQQIGALGVTLPTEFPAGWTLTATSTVQQTLDYANYLIAQAKAGNGVLITQAMIGQLNTTLGQINAEA
jgi:hypothetical protein